MTTYATDWRLLAFYALWTVLFTLWHASVSYLAALAAVRAHDEEGGYVERLRYESLRDEQDRTRAMIETLLSRGERQHPPKAEP